jgi:hypothetical protein
MKTFAVTQSFSPTPEASQDDTKSSQGNKFSAAIKSWWGATTANWPRTILILLLIIFVVSATVKTIGKNGDLSWLFGLNDVPSEKAFSLPDDMALALGPIMALALAIERLIETVFDLFETNLEQVTKYVTGGGNALSSIRKIQDLYTEQLKQATESFNQVLKESEDKSTPKEKEKKKEEAQNILNLAQQKVYEAGTMLENLPKDPKYVAWKRALSIGLGLAMGMTVAAFMDNGVFFYLNLPVPRFVDMLVTGFVLGAGSGPLHSLIGILQSAKDSLTNVGKLADANAIKEEMKSLRTEMAIQSHKR